jgi:hypothetical protein
MDTEKIPFKLKSLFLGQKSRPLGSKSQLFSWKGRGTVQVSMHFY